MYPAGPLSRTIEGDPPLAAIPWFYNLLYMDVNHSLTRSNLLLLPDKRELLRLFLPSAPATLPVLMASQYPYDVDLLKNNADERDELHVSLWIDAQVPVDSPTPALPPSTLPSYPCVRFLAVVNCELVWIERRQFQCLRQQSRASRQNPQRQQSLFRSTIVEPRPSRAPVPPKSRRDCPHRRNRFRKAPRVSQT